MGPRNGNPLYFTTQSNPVVRMAILDNGNVGIGTTSPISPLHVVSSAAGLTTTDFTLDRYSSDSQAPYLLYRKARGTAASPSGILTGDQIGGFYMR